MSVGFLCYLNKMSFDYMLENVWINDPSVNELKSSIYI